MATRKNTHKFTRKAATVNDPLDEEQGVMKRIDDLFQLKEETWAELNKFVSEQDHAILLQYGLEEGDLDGGLGIMAWIASMVKDAERSHQPQVDAAIRYLDPSISA